MTKRAVWPKTMALLVTVCFMGGCERQRPSEVPTPLTTHADRAATVVTPCVHPQVQCGIARQVRAYGGSFVDADRGVEIVFSTDLGQAPVLRAMFLGKAYRGRNMQQRLITAVEVRQAQFDYASLAQWRDTISERLLGKVSGVYSVGIEDDKNRVGIGLDTLRYPGLRGEVLAVLSGAGVPQDAVVFEQQLPFQFDRATPGAALGSAGALFGANDSLVDQPLPLAGGYIERVTPNILGTFGFPVTYNGQNAVVVNSHATNTLFFVDNDTIQEALDPSANTWTSIGHELLDPAGTCGTYCRYSDAALFTVDAGVSFNTGRIALTTDQVPPSTWGVPGSIAVGQGGTSFQAVTVLYPEGQVQAGDWIEKTGPMTGTTQGQLTNICRDVTVAYHGINYTFKCSGWANYYASGGDSGSPVYQSDNGAAQVLGIHFAADAVSHITVLATGSMWRPRLVAQSTRLPISA